ncbi:MAG TPA: hypothetical protein VM913_03995 [Sphingomicrobium sp.]|nr:hypothetical protein [Sphingomicrobium sp.]
MNALISTFRLAVEKSDDDYDLIADQVPVLHFMSMSVFDHADFDPLFILEANFDGPAPIFWGQLCSIFEEELRAMLRCCKRPLDGDGPLYDAVTEPGSRAPVAPYFETRTQAPSVFHHGNRGLTRHRILDDEKLFVAMRKAIDVEKGPSPYRGLEPEVARLRLRKDLISQFPWLDLSAPKRVPLAEGTADVVRLALFAVVLLCVLSLPGLLLAPFVRWTTYLLVVAGLTALVAGLLFVKRRGLEGTEVAGGFPKVVLRPYWLILYAIGIAVYVVIATVLLLFIADAISRLLAALGGAPLWGEKAPFWSAARIVGLGLLAAPLSLGLILLRVRYHEKRDSTRENPALDLERVAEMGRREDWIAQNHMGSIVLIKPGALRTAIIRAGHLGLGLVLRVTARAGYLGNMRTVHFAHWAFLNNGSRLLFLSNFDHSWGSYLDDFIEKASKGLTLAWGSGVGFPPARFLILDGAAHGRLFKTWALASRSVSRFWYSAYRDLTVDQIERNHRLANGLRARSLSDDEASEWMRDL